MEPYALVAGIQVGDHSPVRLMGIINVSPESFFKGSVFSSRDAIRRIAEQMTADGADMLDVGARGTAPYLQTEISVEEEMDRLAQAIQTIREVTDRPISADTQTAVVAQAALNVGASILNDVSGLAHDSEMATIATSYKGVLLMANASATSAQGDPVAVVKDALEAALQRANQAGIAPEHIVLDPGIGFFRDRAISWDSWDRIILQQLSVSRKSVIGKVLGYPNPADRLFGSLGLTALAVYQGAHLIRTHDIAATRDVARIAEWLREPAP
jgi:dihydropteroate synthase